MTAQSIYFYHFESFILLVFEMRNAYNIPMKRVKYLKNQRLKAIEEIVFDITHLPNGYSFWQNLPSKGVKSQKEVKKYWCKILENILFPKELRTALLYAVFDKRTNTPRGESILLYSWIVEKLYNGKEEDVYKDWIKLIYHQE